MGTYYMDTKKEQAAANRGYTSCSDMTITDSHNTINLYEITKNHNCYNYKKWEQNGNNYIHY